MKMEIISESSKPDLFGYRYYRYSKCGHQEADHAGWGYCGTKTYRVQDLCSVCKAIGGRARRIIDSLYQKWSIIYEAIVEDGGLSIVRIAILPQGLRLEWAQVEGPYNEILKALPAGKTASICGHHYCMLGHYLSSIGVAAENIFVGCSHCGDRWGILAEKLFGGDRR